LGKIGLSRVPKPPARIIACILVIRGRCIIDELTARVFERKWNMKQIF
jgi:hypothetical protein